MKQCSEEKPASPSAPMPQNVLSNTDGRQKSACDAFQCVARHIVLHARCSIPSTRKGPTPAFSVQDASLFFQPHAWVALVFAVAGGEDRTKPPVPSSSRPATCCTCKTCTKSRSYTRSLVPGDVKIVACFCTSGRLEEKWLSISCWPSPSQANLLKPSCPSCELLCHCCHIHCPLCVMFLVSALEVDVR